MDNQVKAKKKQLPKPNNVITVPTSIDSDFFWWWCIFMRPFINLTNKEVEVLSCFLKYRWEFSKSISDPALLDNMVMTDVTKKKVIKDCNISVQHFYVVMNNLKKNKIVVNGVLNPKVVPNIRANEDAFQLLVLFKKPQK